MFEARLADVVEYDIRAVIRETADVIPASRLRLRRSFYARCRNDASISVASRASICEPRLPKHTREVSCRAGR